MFYAARGKTFVHVDTFAILELLLLSHKCIMHKSLSGIAAALRYLQRQTLSMYHLQEE